MENKADTKNNTISEIFGDGRLSYDEFLMKTGEAGIEIGDVGEVRGAFEKKIEGLRKNSALERELDRAGVKNRSLIKNTLFFRYLLLLLIIVMCGKSVNDLSIRGQHIASVYTVGAVER